MVICYGVFICFFAGFTLGCRGVGRDKLLHFAVSAVLTKILALLGVPLAGVLIVMTLIFVDKELYDYASGRGKAEWGDIVADYAGMIVAL